MAEPYRQRLSDIAARDLPAKGAVVECKHFFSGAALYAEGGIFATLTPVGLALKLPPKRRYALLRVGGKPLRYFPKAPIKKDYVVLPEATLAAAGRLAPLLEESLNYSLRQKYKAPA